MANRSWNSGVRGLLVLSAFLAPVWVGAETYSVSPTGDDGDPGSLAQPWKSLGRANAVIRPGDTVYLRAGTYRESIRPARSGTASARIRYVGYRGEWPVVLGGSGTEAAVHLARDYITVQQMAIQKANLFPARQLNVALHGDFNEVLDCSIVERGDPETLYRLGYRESGISVSGWGNRIEGNEIARMSLIGIALSRGSRRTVVRSNRIHDTLYDSIRFESSGGVMRGDRVEGNELFRSIVSDGVQFNPDFELSPEDRVTDTSNCGVVLRQNIIAGHAENGIDLKGACAVVIDGNTLYGSRGDSDGEFKVNSVTGIGHDRAGGRAIMHGSSTRSRDVIIRRNVIYDNSGGILLNDRGWVVYHNTIVGNNRDFTGPNSEAGNPNKPMFVGVEGYCPGNNAIKNNLIGDHLDVEVALTRGAHLELDGNLYFYRGAQPFFTVSASPWEGMGFPAWRRALESFSNVSGWEIDSRIASDPGFVNVPPRPTMGMSSLDFRLRAGSPAIDAGQPLTYAVGDGRGTRLRVVQPRYFSNGLEIIDGDLIRVGKDERARVTEVDTNDSVLVLDRTIAWEDRDPVSLDYRGAAPDIGAFEYATLW